ncbi:MAG TPA: phosphate ABC transporter substrate-binding protein [Candidatus Acidoferrum sp.]|nr:phosphate ABC transporter substrate-binding protein [Candidatus Acidoferrum sp.]
MILLSLAVAGCPAGKETATAPGNAPAGKITIRGSNTIGEELAPRLIAEYKKDHSAAEFDLLTKGTAYGMGALMGGFCDIAGASRLPLKEELEVAQFRNMELNDHVIGSYCVAVVLNASNPVSNLTPEQVRDIFTGAITNWKDVGGPDAPIHLYIRDPISGTYIGFKELAMADKPYGSEQNLFTNYEGIVDAVAKDAGGIGYSGFNLTHQPGVKAASIGSVEPTAAAVNQGRYSYARTLHLYTSKGKEKPEVLEFIQFIQSPRGQDVLTQMGYVPHS